MKRLLVIAFCLFQTLTILTPDGDVKFYSVTQQGGQVTAIPLTPSRNESDFTVITPNSRSTGTILNDEGVSTYTLSPGMKFNSLISDD